MSRHHILPPIVYTPAPPKPKETKRRRGIGYAGAAGEADETGETGEALQRSAAHAAAALPQHSRPVESPERKVHSPNGKLSDGTLKELLLAQEDDQDGVPVVGGAVPDAEE